MSEKDYVVTSLGFLQKVIVALFATFCALISFIVAEFKSDGFSFFYYGALVLLIVSLVGFVGSLIAYKKYLNRLRKL